MRLHVIALLTLSCLMQDVCAETAAKHESQLLWNAGFVSDYRFRGISQTRLKPAVQGGVDYLHHSGWYIGTWASNISWVKDAGATDGSIELDVFGGYRWQHSGINFDAAVLRYDYVGNNLGRSGRRDNANTTEAALSVNWAQTTLKYSHTLTQWLGHPNSQNSGYIEVSQLIPLSSDWAFVPHLGYFQVRQTQPSASYTDYALTLQKMLPQGWLLTASLQGTNADPTLYATPEGSFTGRSGWVLGVKYMR